VNCSAAQMRTQTIGSSAVLRGRLLREICRDCGEYYLGAARAYMQFGDRQNALASVNEGLRCVAGPFYLAVKDELETLHTQLSVEMLKAA